MDNPKILVFASGGKTVAEGGGSGFRELVEFSRTRPRVLDADIVGVISNNAEGNVAAIARELRVNSVHWPGPFTAEGYQYYVKMFNADFVMCSGWLKYVRGLDPRTTFNIHPALLPDFGGPGMWGHHVHEAVMSEYFWGRETQSGFSIHFVTEGNSQDENDKSGYDKGPIIFQYPVKIRPEDTTETLAKRVNEKERAWQVYVLNLLVHKRIWLEGDGPEDWEVWHTCLELSQFIPGRYLPPGAEIHNTPKLR